MSGLEFGLLSLGDRLADPNTGACRTESERHRSIVDQAVLAERMGFASIHVGEHHLNDYMVSAPPVLLAAIGERTERLVLSTGVTLMASLDPLRAAEDYSTLEVLNPGRVEVTAGRGGFFQKTFNAFGLDPAASAELFAENVELFIELVTGDDVTWEGRFRSPLERVTIRPRPTGRLPVWIGGGASRRTLDLAARLGCPLVLPSVFAPPEDFVPAVEYYRERWSEAGHGTEAVIGACSHCHVAPTSAGARRDFAVWYEHYWNWVQGVIREFTPQARSLDFDFENLSAGPAIVGSPAEVVDRIGHWRDLFGLSRHLVMFDLGGIPDDRLLATIELFGSEVIPQIG
jgi:alkanesulfonate monooxygenase SsuD/methylene tetrahydromethanopterin reductase-like flavin-dependent oxidoreductase (luciferase family)